MRQLTLWLITAFCCFQASSSFAEQKFALLIGNQTYEDNVGPLINPHNDITVVGKSLEALSFDVTYVKDADFSTLVKSVNRYISRLRMAEANSVSLVYYSGHGAANPESNINYLIPVDVKEADTSTIWDNSVNLKDEILEKLSQHAPDATHYVVVDACRTELRLRARGKKAFEVDGKGFVIVPRSANLLVAFSTSPGSTASDVGESSGPYARVLADEITKPGLELIQVLRNVQRRVKESTGQVPWLDIPSLPMPDVYLAGLPSNSTKPVIIEQAVQPERTAFELERASLRQHLPLLFAQVGEEGVASGGLFNPQWKWPKRSVEICFMDGNPELNSRVASIARQWTLYGELNFDFGDWGSPRKCDSLSRSDVRISYQEDGNWAYVGAQSAMIPSNNPTVNIQSVRAAKLEDLDTGKYNRDVLHEFGHVMGFLHNQSAPSAGCDGEIDWDVVYTEMRNKWGWPRDVIDMNMKSSTDTSLVGSFDRRSIMNYDLPPSFFKEGASSRCFPAPLNELSLRDKLAVYSLYKDVKL